MGNQSFNKMKVKLLLVSLLLLGVITAEKKLNENDNKLVDTSATEVDQPQDKANDFLLLPLHRRRRNHYRKHLVFHGDYIRRRRFVRRLRFSNGDYIRRRLFVRRIRFSNGDYIRRRRFVRRLRFSNEDYIRRRRFVRRLRFSNGDYIRRRRFVRR